VIGPGGPADCLLPERCGRDLDACAGAPSGIWSGRSGLKSIIIRRTAIWAERRAPAFLSLPSCLLACLPLSSLLGTSLATLHSTPPHSLAGDGTPHAPCPQTCGQRHFGIHRLNCDFCDQRRAEQRAEQRSRQSSPARTSRQCRTVGPVRIRCLQLLHHWTGLLPHHTRWTSPLPTVLYVSRQSTEVNSSANLQLAASCSSCKQLQAVAAARKHALPCPALPACARHYGHCFGHLSQTCVGIRSSITVTDPILSHTAAVHLRHGCPHYRNRRAHPFHPPKAAARAGRHAGPSSRVGQTFSRS
jgi:hypothetical protein